MCYETTIDTIYRTLPLEKRISISEDKVKAIRQAPEPKTVSEVRSFLGHINFVSCHVSSVATTTEPLWYITKKDTPLYIR